MTTNNNQNLSSINTAFMNSLSFKAILEQQHQQHIQDQIQKYQDAAFNLTNEELELLICSINDGKNTFNDLQSVIKDLNSATLCQYLVDPPSQPPSILPTIITNSRPSYFQLSNEPEEYQLPYEFPADSTFHLSIPGKNELYRLTKRKNELDLQKKAIFWAKLAAILTGISIAITIGLYVLPKLGY